MGVPSSAVGAANCCLAIDIVKGLVVCMVIAG